MLKKPTELLDALAEWTAQAAKGRPLVMELDPGDLGSYLLGLVAAEAVLHSPSSKVHICVFVTDMSPGDPERVSTYAQILKEIYEDRVVFHYPDTYKLQTLWGTFADLLNDLPQEHACSEDTIALALLDAHAQALGACVLSPLDGTREGLLRYAKRSLDVGDIAPLRSIFLDEVVQMLQVFLPELNIDMRSFDSMGVVVDSFEAMVEIDWALREDYRWNLLQGDLDTTVPLAEEARREPYTSAERALLTTIRDLCKNKEDLLHYNLSLSRAFLLKSDIVS